MNLRRPKLKDAQKIQQQIGGQATMPLALVREIELGTLEIGLGTFLDGRRCGRQAARRA